VAVRSGSNGRGVARVLAGVGDGSTKADEYRELRSKRVLVFGHYSGHGKLSGLKLEDMRTDVAALVHIRDGKVTRLVLYADRDRALADLGLEG